VNLERVLRQGGQEHGSAGGSALRLSKVAAGAYAGRFAAGAAGEALTGAWLRPLTLIGWVVLHDRRMGARTRANIDHIAIGPGGVCVIDTKQWSSNTLRMRHGVLLRDEQPEDFPGLSVAVQRVQGVLSTSVMAVACLHGVSVPWQGWKVVNRGGITVAVLRPERLVWSLTWSRRRLSTWRRDELVRQALQFFPPMK
jgi:Nuclease-related domain